VNFVICIASLEEFGCALMVNPVGCSVHVGRPLACRLFPLGRQIQSEAFSYMHQGEVFPCLDGCPEVTTLPQLTVGEYLKGQQTESFEKAQNEYLQLMQSLADIAFELLLDTGLAESGDIETLPLWRKMANEHPEVLASSIGLEWIDSLTIPEITDDNDDPVLFAQKHNDVLLSKAQNQFGALQTMQEVHKASVLIMGVALHLARSLGANPEILAEHWIDTAKKHGAKDIQA